MDAVNKLIDKARDMCSPATDNALAERMGISRQLISRWRRGWQGVPSERITELAQIAHEDAAAWLVLVHGQQSAGATSKAWLALAKRLGIAAGILLAVGSISFPTAYSATGSAEAVHIMRSGFLRF